MLKQREKQIFLALEMGVDGPFAAVGAGRDRIELGCLVAIAHEDLFGGVEEPGLRFLRPKLLFTQRWHGGCTH
jgi:hypothetical protein